MVADRVADNTPSATHTPGEGTPRPQNKVADGCRWLQINQSICNHTNHLSIKGLSHILRARLQSCR